MMYPEIIPLVRLISEMKIECLLNTNGVLVLDKIDDLEGVDIYSISLDGPRDLNDYYRGAGVYDKVLKVVEEVRRRGKRVQLQYTMTRDLKNSFSHVNAIAEEYGCFIGINFLRPQQQASGAVVTPGEATQEEILDFVDWLIRENPPAVPYPRNLLRYVRNWPFGFHRHLVLGEPELKGFKPIPCAAGSFLIAIEHQGNIFPCTKHFYGSPIGNCADGNIKEAWKNLKPVRCQACLDLGCNLLNFNIQFVPSTILGLTRVLTSRKRAGVLSAGKE
jgi:MoaA/NifB/PqqE/SkfB family radical SAM enzyme